jgi:hypothetical protein
MRDRFICVRSNIVTATQAAVASAVTAAASGNSQWNTGEDRPCPSGYRALGILSCRVEEFE